MEGSWKVFMKVFIHNKVILSQKSKYLEKNYFKICKTFEKYFKRLKL